MPAGNTLNCGMILSVRYVESVRMNYQRVIRIAIGVIFCPGSFMQFVGTSVIPSVAVQLVTENGVLEW